MNRRHMLKSTIGTLLMLNNPKTPARAATSWSPNGRNVNVMIPFSPGGGTDILFKGMQSYGEPQGITFVPEYRGGAEGLIGVRAGAAARADGLHLTLANVGAMSHVHNDFNAVQSFDHITGIRTNIFFVVTSPGSEINTLQDLFLRLKSDPSKITGGSGAPGQRTNMEELLRAADITDYTITNYRGASNVIQDLVGNHIQWGMIPGSAVIGPINSGAVKLIATDRRPGDPNIMPGIPTIFDVVPLFNKHDFHLISMPRNVPEDAKIFWKNWFQEYLSSSPFLEGLLRDYCTPVVFGPDHVISSVRGWRQQAGLS